MPRSWPHFSGQSALPSLPIYHQCVAHVPPILIIFFLSFFNCKFQHSRCKFSKFSFPRPFVFQEKSAPSTLLLGTRVAHTHQKKVECPPPRVGNRVTHEIACLKHVCYYYGYMRKCWEIVDFLARYFYFGYASISNITFFENRFFHAIMF